MFANQSIRETYNAKKSILKSRGTLNPKPSSLGIAAERIAKLQSEVELLKEKTMRSYNNSLYGNTMLANMD